jgi:hypothetical protein
MKTRKASPYELMRLRMVHVWLGPGCDPCLPHRDRQWFHRLRRRLRRLRSPRVLTEQTA